MENMEAEKLPEDFQEGIDEALDNVLGKSPEEEKEEESERMEAVAKRIQDLREKYYQALDIPKEEVADAKILASNFLNHAAEFGYNKPALVEYCQNVMALPE